MATWGALPSDAVWYGEVIGAKPGNDIDYVDAYSADEVEPDIDELIPDGWVVEEWKVLPTPKNPAWIPSSDED